MPEKAFFHLLKRKTPLMHISGLLNRLWVRLALAMMLVTWLTIASIAFIVNPALENNFRRYVQQQNFVAPLVTRIEDYYAQNDTFDGLSVALASGFGRDGARAWPRMQLLSPTGDILTQAERPSQRRNAPMDAETTDTADELLPDMPRTMPIPDDAVPILHEGQTIAWLAFDMPGPPSLDSAGQGFLETMRDVLVWVALGGGVLAALVGFMIAWQLARPLRDLTQAAQAMASGKRGQQVMLSGTDEIRELGVALNTLSHNLAEGEAIRARMAANVAHELRTPVAILRAHLEALLDGVYALEAAQIAIAHDQSLHLARLVDDLRLLTLAEARQIPLEKQTITPADLIGRVVDGFMPLVLDAGIDLQKHIAPDLPPLRVDIDRIRQVLGNLLANALRHTPADGQIVIAVQHHAEGVQVRVSNSGATQQLPSETDVSRLFEPFWRADAARTRDAGGSGLGLAISRELVRSHGGDLTAQREGDIMTFTFTLPL